MRMVQTYNVLQCYALVDSALRPWNNCPEIISIVRLGGTGNYTLILFIGGRKPLLIAQTVKTFQRQLPHFIRVSKSALLDPAYIENVIRLETRRTDLRLTTGLVVGVCRHRVVHTLTELALTQV